ncbi:MAG: tail fiber protein [Pseudomonadota bacterium]
MSDPYIGEIRMFGGNFAPLNWAFCNGALLSIADYNALYALIGTTYGGDGVNTFGVPDLRGRVPVHQGTLPGGQNYVIGAKAGVETVTLITGQLPTHTHVLTGNSAAGELSAPQSGAYLAAAGPAGASNTKTYVAYDGSNQVQLNAQSVSVTGANQSHNNIQPTLAVNFIISLFGIFPTQN